MSVLAITRSGVRTALELKKSFPSWSVHAPAKLSGGGAGDGEVEWFEGAAGAAVGRLFAAGGGMVCLFSLGAVVRLVAPHLRDKKTDPAVVVVDEGAKFAISVLSGHIGGANRLAEDIAARTGATPVITTAADVIGTIPVDMVGRKFRWEIDGDEHVTAVSACMVNGDAVGLYQDAGRRDWWAPAGKKGAAAGGLPANVTEYGTERELAASDAKALMIISDRTGIAEGAGKGRPSVTYRPKTLAVGVGLHWDTAEEEVRAGLEATLERFSLSRLSVAAVATMRKARPPAGLEAYAASTGVRLEYVEPEMLARVPVPNPSDTVAAFEGTPSVAEAAALLASGGELLVEKQKFPPNLTVAVARTAAGSEAA